MKQRMKRWLSGAMAAVLALTMLTTLPDVVTMPVTAAVTQQQINDLLVYLYRGDPRQIIDRFDIGNTFIIIVNIK